MYKTTILSIIILSIAAFSSCNRQNSSDSINNLQNTNIIHYADLLSIQEIEDSVSLISIKDPWHTDRIMMEYLLVPQVKSGWTIDIENSYLEKHKNLSIIHTPLNKNAITASSHAYLLSQLGGEEKIAVLCDTSYIKYKPFLDRMRIEFKKANYLDGGTSNSPNVEVLLSAKCVALWISPYDNTSLGAYSSLPFHLIYCADYMETTPLGRAEWMKFYGRLIGKKHEADSLFESIVQRYNKIQEKQEHHSKLLVELPYGATWYVPGGASNAAILYAEAGFDYLWKEDNHPGSLSLSKEAVLAKSTESDIWLIKYYNPRDWTLEDVLAQDPLYKNIKAVKTGNVWGCNTELSDYFDIAPFRPDTILESLQTMNGSFFKKLQ